MNFCELISPITKEEFRTKFLDKAVCFVSRQRPDFYDGLIDQEYLRTFLLNGGLRASECRLVKDGSADLSPYSYTGGHSKKSGFATADIDRFVDGPKVMRLYAEGYSISLIGLDRYHPSLAILKNRLMLDLNAHISVNLYASPAHSTGLPIHEDVHDVLVLQIYGKKQWQIFDKESSLPLPGQTATDYSGKAEVQRFVLEPGDFAYVPRGFSHRATAFNGPSIHLTIGIRWVTYFDVFQQLMIQLSATHRDMRASFGSFRELSNPNELLQKLSDMLSMAPATEAMDFSLAAIEKQWIDGIAPVHHLGVLSVDLLHDELSLNSILRVVNPEFTKLRKRSGKSILLYPGQQLEVHPCLETIVTSILEHKNSPFCLKAVVDLLHQEAQVQFIVFLIKDGLLEVLRGNNEQFQ